MSHLRDQWRMAAGRRPLPTGGMFSPGQDDLDPRLFDGDRLRPEVRARILSVLDGFWTPKYGDWRKWAKVYLAGSGASHWWDSDSDLDILIGIDKKALDRARPQNVGVSEEDAAKTLSRELKDDLVPATAAWHGFVTTFFVNPGSWNILDINPYAAYDVTNDAWIQKPPMLPVDWSPDVFPPSWWDRINEVADEVEALLDRDDASERGEDAVAYFDKLHAARQKAYTIWGKGWIDWGNFQYQVLSQWGLLQPLYQAKQAAKLAELP